jgi:cytochrome c553
MLLPVVLLSLSLILLPGTGRAEAKLNALQAPQQKAAAPSAQTITPPVQTSQKEARLKKTDPYLDSAHGSSQKGVSRPEKVKDGFARANCSHCHDFHGGSSDAGARSSETEAFPYNLYARGFDPTARTGQYSESTNFCFSCHNDKGSIQQLENQDISRGMGCSTLPGTTDILASFNLPSRHNLYDIWKFLDEDQKGFQWFTQDANPCSGCHNPHLARNKKDNPRDVMFSTLSKPSTHSELLQRSMEGYQTRYEPPFCSGSKNREPSGSLTAEQARAGMIDYSSFCTDCHNEQKTIFSSTLQRNLVQIDWGVKGDVHGDKDVGKSLAVKPPYRENSLQNYLLSCLDCHEAHGSANTALLRNWVNGGKLPGTITTSIATSLGTGENNRNTEMGFLCMRCHQQDPDTGTASNTPPRWQNIHHGTLDSTAAPDFPYPLSGAGCESCHETEGAANDPLPIDCVNCHFHGSSDDWLKELATGRDTF